MKKRWCCILMALVFLFTFAPMMVGRAAGAAAFSLDKVSGKAGESVQLHIQISGNPGIVATLLHIKYNHAVLELTGVANGDVMPEATATFNADLSSEDYRLTWLDALAKDNYTGEGTLATLTFRIRDNAPVGESAVTISYDADSTFNSDLQPVRFSVYSGSVTVLQTIKHVTGVSVQSSLTMTFRQGAKLAATVYPTDAANQAVTWSSSDNNIVSVDANGNLTNHRAGSATITVTAVDGGASAQCYVTVQYTFLQKIIIYVLFGWLWYVPA